ncbi:hypothetical protein Hanom_Chr02g00106681 [Helianthus anomalus]
MFFEFCGDIGVGNTSKCPKMALIPEEVIQELKDIISGDLKLPKEEVKSVIVVSNNSISSLKSVITDDWVVSEEQKKSNPALISPPVKNNTRLHDLISL